MRRTHRVLLALVATAGSIGLVVLLVFAGSAGEGPLSTLLLRIGTGVSNLEIRLVRSLRGPGRAAELGWLEPLREHPDSLRRPDSLLLGAYDGAIPASLEELIVLEQAMGVRFALIQMYTAWGDAPEHAFPERIVEAVRDLGSIPVVTWEPWLTTFENRLHPHLPLRADRDRGGLAGIARGDYDFYIDTWARNAARFGRPLIVRFAHEMNDPYRYPWGPQHNEPQDFIAAWRRVVDRFRAAGATNVLWAWSPHVAYAGYEVYWPGDDYVDWVATGALNYGTVAYWSRWWSFQEIFGQHYEFLEGLGKPIMIAEFGSLAVGGDRAAWYRQALNHLRERHPEVYALLFFHVEGDATVTSQRLDWSLLDDPETLEAVRGSLMPDTSAGEARPSSPGDVPPPSSGEAPPPSPPSSGHTPPP